MSSRIVSVCAKILAYVVRGVLNGSTRGRAWRGGKKCIPFQLLKCCWAPASYSDKHVYYCAAELKHYNGVIPYVVTQLKTFHCRSEGHFFHTAPYCPVIMHFAGAYIASHSLLRTQGQQTHQTNTGYVWQLWCVGTTWHQIQSRSSEQLLCSDKAALCNTVNTDKLKQITVKNTFQCQNPHIERNQIYHLWIH